MTTQEQARRPVPADITENSFVIGPGTVGRSDKRVRAFSSGELVVDSRWPLQVWEHPHYPEYFFAAADLMVKLRPDGHGPRSQVLGVSEVFDVLVGERVVPRAARRFPEATAETVRDAYALTWSAFDTWMEEDEVVYTHPRSRSSASTPSPAAGTSRSGSMARSSPKLIDRRSCTRPALFRATTFHALTCGWTG